MICWRIVISLLLATVSSTLLAQQTSDGDYEARLEKLKQTIQQLDNELQSAKGNRDELQSALRSAEKSISSLTKQIIATNAELNTQQQQLNKLKRERQQLQQAKRDQQHHIAQEINAAYRLGKKSNIKLLLNQESPEQLSRMLRYHQYLLSARSEAITSYLNTITELNQLEPRIEKKRQQLDHNQQQLQQRHQQLSDKQHSRQRTLAKLNKTITTKDAQLSKLIEDRQRLSNLLQQVAEAVAAIPIPENEKPFTQAKGQLLWPTKGHVKHRFGSSRVAGKLKWHGVMINAASGRDVLAVYSGRVVFANYLRGHGMLLIIDHGNNYMSLYAHNQSLLRETGDWVATGETIASVGNSGGLKQAGLYFEIRHQGKPVNPARWLKKG